MAYLARGSVILVNMVGFVWGVVWRVVWLAIRLPTNIQNFIIQAESPISHPSLCDMPSDIILLIADVADMDTRNSLSRTCRGFSVLLKRHMAKDSELQRAIDEELCLLSPSNLRLILQSPSTTRRGLVLVKKAIDQHQKQNQKRINRLKLILSVGADGYESDEDYTRLMNTLMHFISYG